MAKSLGNGVRNNGEALSELVNEAETEILVLNGWASQKEPGGLGALVEVVKERGAGQASRALPPWKPPRGRGTPTNS